MRSGEGAGWCEEDAVRLVSELPQARTASVSWAHVCLAMPCKLHRGCASCILLCTSTMHMT